MAWFFGILAGILISETSLLCFGGLWFRNRLIEIAAKLYEFQGAVGDDARQNALLLAGRKTVQFSLAVLGVLLVLGEIAYFPFWVFEWGQVEQATYLLVASIVATGWWLVRRGRKTRQPELTNFQDSGYGIMDMLVHWLALGPESVRRLTFDLERQFFLPRGGKSVSNEKLNCPADGSVYVCGLARSGTTMLLRIIDGLEDFRSLTYRDMPFVLAPNLWHKVAHLASQQAEARERAHGDGILVSMDSPEGLEEVFWRTFGTQVFNADCLGFDEPTPALLKTFSEYRAIVANPRTGPGFGSGVLKRYLSKNNNNLLRLRSLCADPTATVLLAYRNPFATARSLHRQHQRFSVSQARDRFTRSYMGWLSHYEFGLDHRPFCFALSGMSGKYRPDELDYWLEYWNAVYRYVLANDDLRYILVSHDTLRAHPVRTLERLFEVLGVEADSEMLSSWIAQPDLEVEDGFDPALIARAGVTYRELLESSRNILPICRA